MTNQTRRKFIWALAGSVPGLALLTTWLQSGKNVSPVSLDSLDSNERFDVCIAGSGPAGTVLACELSRQGVKTVILEAGEIGDDTFDKRKAFFYLSKEFSYPIDSTRYIAIGGTSNVWSGFCPRYQPLDFEVNSYSPMSEPWPINYRQLEPYYNNAEQELHVRGGDTNPYSPPRTAAFPFMQSADEGMARLSEFLGKAGYVIEQPPLSDWSGTGPINVRRSHLPGYERTSLGKLVSGARVTRMLPAGNGTIGAWEAQGNDGLKKLISARFYVLACGGIETPRLLLLSRSPEFPNGIGNDYDLVGRHFMEHLHVKASGRMDATVGRDDPSYTEAISWQFNETFKTAGCGGIIVEFQSPKADVGRLGISAILEMEPNRWNRVVLDDRRKDPFGNPKASVVLKLSERDQRTIERARGLMVKIFYDVKMQNIEVSERINWIHHHMGTCRMATDPSAGVVDGNLKVHGTDNLYVTGSASFVTSSAAPPTLSIVALTLRLADHLVEKLRGATAIRKWLTAPIEGAVEIQ